MNLISFNIRYQILAASAIPSGFIDGKVAAEKLIDALQLDQSEFRVGTTKVFFRAGIVGELEDMRDERLAKIISQFQAYCKGHLARLEYKKMCDQRLTFWHSIFYFLFFCIVFSFCCYFFFFWGGGFVSWALEVSILQRPNKK